MADERPPSTSVASAAALAVAGTTCCALPAALVALGAGGAVASLFSGLPWLVTLSKYKGITFALTAGAIGYSFWRLRRVAAVCDVADARRIRLQRVVLTGATGLLVVSLFAAYALLPLARWWDG